MIYIGVDPGKNGGIACISDNKNSGEAYPYSDDLYWSGPRKEWWNSLCKR